MGTRKIEIMNDLAKDMSDAELTAISDYVAGLPSPPSVTTMVRPVFPA